MKIHKIAESSVQRIICAVLLTVMFFVGAFTVPQYGYYYDEGGERQIVSSNFKEYALRLLSDGSRMKEKFLQIDSNFTDIDGGPIKPISQSIERDHGVAIMYPTLPFLLAGISPTAQSELWYGYVFLIFFTSVLALYFIGRRLFGSYLTGILSAAVYFFSPVIFAQSHYNNKDILLLALTLDLMALILRMIDKIRSADSPGKPSFLLAAVTAGFIMNTKVIGIAVVGLFGLLFIASLAVMKIPAKKIVTESVLLLFLSLLFYFLFTPAMWGGVKEIVAFHRYLIENANDFSRWDQLILFNGVLYKHSVEPLPRSYLITMIALTTPFYVLVFSVFGAIRLICRMIKEGGAFFRDITNLFIASAFCLFLIPTGYATITGAHIYNGWRHFSFVYAGIVLLCVYGICSLGKAVRKRTSAKSSIIVYSALVFSFVCASAVGIAVNHPFQYAYFNVLAPNADEKYELDYWNVSLKSAVDHVIENSAGFETPPTVGGSDINTLNGLISTVMLADCGDKITLVRDDPSPDYVIENITYSSIYGQEYFDASQYTPIKTFYSYGNKVCTVYRLNS